MVQQEGTVAQAYVREVTRQDVSILASLVRQLAVFENLTDICTFTDDGLEEALFKLPPYQGPTALLLEVSRGTPALAATDASVSEGFQAASHELELDAPVADAEEEEFRSAIYPDRVVVGYVLFIRNFSTFLAKSGFYIEDIYVREPYRKKGLGTILLRTVATEALKHGAGRVEWCVLDWNVNAIKFYESMGADVLPEWRICRLTGDKLNAYSG